jgi:predicted NBD/HSP70 family sugar kinase
LIDLNPTGSYVIGAEINPSYLLVGLFDFTRELVDHLKVSLDLDHSADHIVHLLEVTVKGLLSKHAILTPKLTGLGVTLSGSISSNGVVQLSSPLGWKQVPLKDKLTPTFECPVWVYTTKVRLLAEMDVQPISSNNIVYLNAANGVGSTGVVDGRLINGSTNRCGEIGHVVVDPEGPLCGCGQRGCLEAMISGPALVTKIKNDLVAGRNSVLSDRISEEDSPETMSELLKCAIEQGDPYAHEIREFIATHLARSAAIVINLFDPDVVILGGYVCEVSRDYFAARIKREFENYVYDHVSRNVEIVFARAGEQAPVKGVAAAILQQQYQSDSYS